MIHTDFYVYLHMNPRKLGEFVYGDFEFDHEPFYVGKGQGDRINGVDRNPFWKNIENKIIKAGKEVIKIRLFDSLSEEESFLIEKELISLIGRRDQGKGPLTNLTDGGEGVVGAILTEEHKRKISISLKGRKPWNTGKTLSEAHKKKIGRKGKGNSFYGKTHSKEIRKKMSESIKKYVRKYGGTRTGAVLSEETKLKISKAHQGKKASKETKRKMCEAAKGRPPQSIETRLKKSRTLVGHSVSEETRRKISETLKRRFAHGLS